TGRPRSSRGERSWQARCRESTRRICHESPPMREMGDGTFVPYAEVVARRHRRLRILMELRSQARAHTIEGEVLHAHTEDLSAVDQEERPDVSNVTDGCGTEHDEGRLAMFKRSRRV